MTDTPDTPDAPAPAPAAAPNHCDGQLVVSIVIVAALAVVAVALVGAACVTKNWSGMITVGTIVGALATALNAPTGIANALRASKGDGQ